MKSGLRILAVIALSLVFLSTRSEDIFGQSDEPSDEEILTGTIDAPDFPRGLEWLNIDRPLTMEDLQGKIVLLDFWTFCCINCLHVIPDLKKLEKKYSEHLVVIGVHSAKFPNEQGTESIRQAILRYGIEHAVVNDKDFRVWTQYEARAWPTFVLINPHGRVIGSHSGEGAYRILDPIISQAVEYFDELGELSGEAIEYSLESLKAPNTLLSFPGKIESDPTGNRLVLTDTGNNRILILKPDGEIVDVLGSGSLDMNDGVFSEATFNNPQGTALDGDVLYIADTENHLIRAANLTTREVTTQLGPGSQARRYNMSGYGRSVALNSPWDVVVEDGKLYIAMAGSHQLWVSNLETSETKPYAGSAREALIDGRLLEAALAQPSGITSDGKKLYFADSETSAIRYADLGLSGEVGTYVGNGLFEFGDIDGSSESARLQHPLGIVHHDGLLYIADTYNSKIKTVDPENSSVRSFAGDGKHGDRDGKGKKARFHEPSGLTVLGSNLYVADANNHSVRIVDLANGEVSTLALHGLEMLAEVSSGDFTGRVVEGKARKLRPGKVKLSVEVRIPKGHKLNELAPMFVSATSSDGNVIAVTSEPEMYGSSLMYEFELDAVAEGEAVLSLESLVYMCPEKSTLCIVDNVKVEVPIVVTNGGNDSFSISVDAQTTPM